MKLFLNQKGVTLIELIIVIIIITTLALIIMPRFMGRTEEARRAAAVADIETGLGTAIDLYEFDNGQYPASLDDLVKAPQNAPNWRGPYIKNGRIPKNICLIKDFFKPHKKNNYFYNIRSTTFYKLTAMKNLLSLFLFFLCSSLIAQYHVPKFGDIDINDLKMTRYEKDTTADALILFDNGSSSFELNENRQFDFMFERHLRIKIFRKSGFRFADVPIRLYRNNQNKEKLVGLKAVTYNLVNDKIVKTKLNNNNIYETEDKRYIENRFAFPEVKEGSIIELEYTIISDYLYDLRGWNFQYSCPALLSQYSTSIPEYFDYRRSAKGYLRFDIATDKKGKKTYIVHYDSELPTSVNGGHRLRTIILMQLQMRMSWP